MAEIFDLDVTDADNTGRFPEGQAPSTVNNGARALEGLLARGLKDTINPNKTTTGSANAQALSPNATVAALAANMMFTWKAGYTNTGAMTLNVADTAATGAKSIKLQDGSDPHAGAVTVGGYYTTVYDGTNHRLLNPTGIGDGAVTTSEIADGSITTAKIANLAVTAAKIAGIPIIGKNASYTLAAGDRNYILAFILTATATLTVPSGATLGAQYSVGVENVLSSTANLTLSATGLFDGNAEGASIVLAPGESCRITSDGTNWLVTELVRQFPASLAQNGWQKLPSGLIIQWGLTAAIPADSSATVTLPIAFPTGPRAVTATTAVNLIWNQEGQATASFISNSQMTVGNGGNGAYPIYWEALGY